MEGKSGKINLFTNRALNIFAFLHGMSDQILHECGIAFIRLKKPFSYYLEKYGSVLYGINRLYLLMEKQHNRGQDGAGIAAVKLGVTNGYPYLKRIRSNQPQALAEIFSSISSEVKELERFHKNIHLHPDVMKGHLSFLGELMLGHLRYGTQGKNEVEYCHPFIKRDVDPARNLCLAGNFNLVNTEELFKFLKISPGPLQQKSDLSAMMEVIHHFMMAAISTLGQTDIMWALRKACALFDGGYTIGGLTGNGISFVVRDAHGIRPAYYLENDEVVVAASERAAIRTAFNAPENAVKELPPGHAMMVDAAGKMEIQRVLEPQERRACSFERIYFSRGSDEKIYRERIALGHHLSEPVLKAVNYDLKHTIVSYIPNTAEIAFYGLCKGMEDYLNAVKTERILSWGNNVEPDKLMEMIGRRVRQEKIAIKDVKLRTFITDDNNRDEMVQHVYDITYGTVGNNDTLVVIDDSIVRGTTLRQSIIRMLARLGPKKIIVVSSAPQIRYPDCYGIDMSRLSDFVAFNAVMRLHQRVASTIPLEVYNKCLDAAEKNRLAETNFVKEVYDAFSTGEITREIASLVKPEDVSIPVEVIFQTIESLHDACPTNKGDWYFTGNYPTPGGNRVANKAFMNYMEGKKERSY